jgi:hypothetical protein
MTAPSAPSANGIRFFAEDNGSGLTRLVAKFAPGTDQVIAQEGGLPSSSSGGDSISPFLLMGA